MSDATIDAAELAAIHQLLGSYAHYVDSARWDRFSALFTDDAVFDMSSFGGGRYEGRDAIVGVFSTFGEHSAAHLMTNVFVEEIDGEVRATSNWFIARQGVLLGGVYYDVLVKTPGGWQFRSRVATHTWTVPEAPADFLEAKRG
jgi:3-phenylpropionate/cinnamic acid dioxygenase small subunit